MFGFLKRLFGSSQSATEAESTPAPSAPKSAPEERPEPSTNTTADYVIVGAGPAGVMAADTLRKEDPNSEIVMIGAEDEEPYSRMAIPYVLTNLIEEGGTYLRKDDDHYGSAGIKVVRASVDSVDAGAKTIALSNGTAQSYGKLLIATGASPVKPPVEGLDLPGVSHCWTLADARAIAEKAAEGSTVVLMGAGFIGCIILESLLARGVKLTVVEALDRMVPRMMNQTAGNLIKTWCEEKGATVHTSTKVTKIADADGALAVEMDNGETVSADLVVVATGVKSNTAFLDGSGVEVEDGIKVNDRLQSSNPDIYAAGDCAQGPDFSTGGWSVHAIQPTATDHGRIAALNMAGQSAPYQGSLNMNVLDTAGLISASFGDWEGAEGGSSAEVLNEASYRYIRLQFKDDRLVGALSLGHTDHIGCLRGLIQSKRKLGVWKERLMKDPNRIAEAYVGGSQ